MSLAQFTDQATRISEAAGAAAAEAARQKGQIWGQTMASLGQLPQQAMTADLQRQELQNKTALTNLQLQEGQRNLAGQQAMDDAYAKAVTTDANGKPTIDESKLLQGLPGHLIPIVQNQLNETKQKAATLQKTYAEANDAAAKAATEHQNVVGSAFQAVAKSNYDPDVFHFVLKGMGDSGHLNPQDVQTFATDAADNPDHIKEITDRLIAQSPKQTELSSAAKTAAARELTANTGAIKTAAELPGIQAKTTVEQQVAAGTQGGITPEQQARLKLEAEQRAIAAGQLGVARAREAREATTNQPLDLTPEGLDAAALNYAKTGQLPPLGMGDKVTRKQIINRAAEIGAGTGEPIRTSLDLASARAGFASDENSLKQLQKQRDAISAFEQTAKNNIDIFLKTAGKVVDTGSPLINTPARALSGKALGSENQAEYDAARQVALNEVAKIVSNPNLSGQLSDAARKEVEAFNPSNATLKQSVAVMRVLKQDMANRAAAYDAQLQEIKNRLKATPGAKPQTPAPATKPTAAELIKKYGGD